MNKDSSQNNIRSVILAIREGLTSIVEQLNSLLEEMAPETAIPTLDLEALPWLKRDKTPCKPSDWGWLFGPGSTVGPPKGSEPLVLLLDKHGGKVELPPYEITYSKDRTFIQRRPLKESTFQSHS